MDKQRERPWAVVTGASSGMGADFARQLAGRGYNLVLAARRAPELEALAAQILKDSPGVQTRVVAADLSCVPGRSTLLSACQGIKPELLINNAGFGAFGPFDAITEETEESMIRLNVSSLVALTRAFSQGMREAGRGRILFTSSIAAFQPCPYYASYAATKSFVLSYALAIRRELRGSGVSVTVLCPGVTKTAFFDVAQQYQLSAFQRRSMQESPRVVRGALKALMSGRPIYVPGFFNALNAFATRFVSRPLAAGIAQSMLAGSSPK